MTFVITTTQENSNTTAWIDTTVPFGLANLADVTVQRPIWEPASITMFTPLGVKCCKLSYLREKYNEFFPLFIRVMKFFKFNILT
jgi:hypothetical protein